MRARPFQLTIDKVKKYLEAKQLPDAYVTANDGRLDDAAQYLKDAERDLPVGSVKAFTDAFMQRAATGSNDEKGAQLMQISLYAYAKVMRKRVADVVPQMVHTALVADVSEHMQPKLLAAMTSERLRECAVDGVAAVARRAEAVERCEKFSTALTMLNAL